jgi:signal transduction histidine kinase
LVIEHERGGEMVVAAGAGELPAGLVGQSVDVTDGVASAALRTGSTLRLETEPNRARFDRHGLGRLGFHIDAGLVVPLTFRGQGHGVLIAVDRLTDGPAFTAEDQRLLAAFAASAATAIATAQSVHAERASQRLAAAEQERGRWARALHDETLQNLAALRLALGAQLRSDDLDTTQETIREAVDQLESEIATLRSLITDLRPTALDDLGVTAAIEDLAERTRRRGLDVELRLNLDDAQSSDPAPRSTELETALYRITQEALTNARKHGRASNARVEIQTEDHFIHLTVYDDGAGFDPQLRTSGFGMHGMRERAEAVGGTLKINSAPGQGTHITATLPTHRTSQQQLAS